MGFCGVLPHESKVAWSDRFLSFLVWVDLSPSFFKGLDYGVIPVASRDVAGAWPVVIPEARCHVAKGLLES